MKILSFNMRGWGDTAKRRRLSSLIKSGAFDMCLLQETKRATFEDFMIHNLWGHIDVDWVAKESRGLSGGLLTVWNKNFFTYRYSFSGDGFLGICVDWKSELLYIVNIYSSCLLAGKRKLWKDLLEFKSNNDAGLWCLGGDFNSISTIGERRGRQGASN
jgi:exonuclease III